MAVTPPFNKITELPALGVDFIQQQLNNITDLTLNDMKLVIQGTVKLPNDVNCNDPRVKDIKESLQSVQDNLQTIQDNIPKIQQTISQVQTIVKTGIAIKNAIAIAQLSNPITAALFIAQISQQIQDELITNALEAIKPLEAMPQQSLLKLQTLMPPLTDAISKLNNTCNENTEVKVPILNDVESDSDSNNFPAGFDYNDLLASEFYQDVNVSETDLDQRSDTIQQLVEQQQNLLTSLLEAPSQVYKQNGIPPVNLGKIGDFYVDTQNNIVYGPKVSDSDWGGPLN